MFYEDGEPYKIVKLSQSEFDYEALRESGVQVDEKFVVTCPVGALFPFTARPERLPNNNPRFINSRSGAPR